MTLLQPWSAAIAGGAGLGVLTLLYVLKLRRTSLRVGSTLLWERALADVEVNTPWRRLRLDWLFLLQAVAIAGLAVAVGRPALGIGSARQRVIVAIDASASMGATDGAGAGGAGETRLAEAKRRAIDLVENLRRARGVEGAVVAFAGEARVVRGMTRQSASIIDGIQSVQATDETGDLRAALEAIGTLTAGTTGSEGAEDEAVAYIFSDGGFDAGEAGPTTASLTAPAGVSVRLVRVGPGPDRRSGNIGIVAMTAQRDAADPATVRVVARLVSTFSTARDVSLRVLIDGETVGASTATLAPGGDTVIVLPVGVRTPGVLTLRVLNDDALAADNAAQVVIDGAREPVVVVVGPGTAGRDADPLVVNFAQSVGRDGGGSAARVIGVESVTPDPAFWKGVDLVVFDRVEPAPGAVPPVASVSLGAGLAAAGIRLQPGRPGEPDRVVTWRRDDPLMRDVALDGLVLRGVGTLHLPAMGVALAEGSRGVLIGRVDGPDGIGRAVAAFSADQGGWGSDLSFVVFMGNTMDYLTLRGKMRAGRQVRAGEQVAVRVSAGSQGVTVTGPGGATWTAPASADAPAGGLRVVAAGRAERAGVYRVEGAVEDDARIAVNMASPVESGLATADALPLAPGRGVGVRGGAVGSQPREVWDWFVLGALGVLAVEWLLYAYLARR